jgi:hypothetical protein
MDGEEGRGGVVVSPEELEDLQLSILLLQPFPGCAEVRFQGLVLFFQGEPPYPQEIVVVGAQLRPGIVAPFQRLQPRQGFPGLFLVLPEIGLGSILFDFVDLLFQRSRVKDPSRFPRSGCRVSAVSVPVR